MVSLIPLPKLAVTAKFLILILMVVTCESIPLVSRKVRLYNQCTYSYLTVNMTGAVAADNSEDGFENLIIQSRDYSGKLLIYGEKSERYLCFNPRWKLIGSRKVRGPLCYFTEEMGNSGYSRFRSAVNKGKFLGFAASGRQLRGRAPANPSCTNWVKLDPEFSIPKHNEVVAGPPVVPQEVINRELAAGARAPRRRHRHRKRRPHTAY